MPFGWLYRRLQGWVEKGSLQDLLATSETLSKSNWHAILHASSKSGHAGTTLSLFRQMLQCHVEPREHAFVAVIKACSSTSSLAQGMLIHVHIIDNGFDVHVFLVSALIDMYVKCLRLRDAQHIFDRSRNNNVVSWTALIAGYAQNGHGQEGLALFAKMQQQGLVPNHVTFVCVLKLCSSLATFDLGRLCHYQIIEGSHELTDDESIGNTLIDMYSKCGSVEDARRVFDSLPNKNVVAWSAMIAGYVQQAGHKEQVFFLFHQMQQEGVEPGHVTYVSVLMACVTVEACRGKGRLIHAILMASPSEFDIFVGNALVNMYAKSGDLLEARRVFDKMPKLDVVTWSTMLTSYADQGVMKEVFFLFTRLHQDGMVPDSVVFGSLLKVCIKVAALDQGRSVHSLLVENNHEDELFLGSSLIHFYIRCQKLDDARQVFEKLSRRNVVTWSALIAGYTQLELSEEALLLFMEMQEDGVVPDAVAYVSMLKASSYRESMVEGKLSHEHTIQDCAEQNIIVASSLINLYVKRGNLKHALELFDQLGMPHVAAWSAMISGLSQQGYCEAALQLFQQMRKQGIEVDTATYVCIANACSKMTALEEGKLIHAQIKPGICETDSILGSTLIDMYSKCGCLVNAQTVFNKLTKPDVVAWSSLIAGYAENSDYHIALHHFECMQVAGVKPNDVTYISLLGACCHRGLLDEGCHHFESMQSDHKITPTIEHYSSMVDLCARVGLLKEARDILLTMPIFPSLVSWMSLLSHCRTHGRVDLGRMCFENIVMIDESHASSYELMSKLYVEAGRFGAADELQERRKHAQACKKIGKAFIETHNKVTSFVAGGKEHEQYHDTCLRLQKVTKQMKGIGFIPLVDTVLQQPTFVDDDVL